MRTRPLRAGFPIIEMRGRFAPVRVLLYENAAGHGTFEYDSPATTFGRFGDQHVIEVARELDAAMRRVLQQAAERGSC